MHQINMILLTIIFCQIFQASQSLSSDEKLHSSAQTTYRISVSSSDGVGILDTRFLSMTIDSSAAWRRWAGFNFSSPRMKNLAKALSPSDLRFGGTLADYLIFDPTSSGPSMEEDRPWLFVRNDGGSRDDQPNFTLSGKELKMLTDFVKNSGWDFIFDFNVFLTNDGEWNPSNAELLLNYSAGNGIKIPYFQLGNEPDLYEKHLNVTITPARLVKDFQILRQLLKKYPAFKNSKVYGPDVTNLGPTSRSTEYFRSFLDAGGANVVDELSLHHYYMDGSKATLDDFLDPVILDSLKTVLDVAVNVTSSVPGRVKLRLSETSSCYGGGAPGLSNAYVAGFLWLDKLGVSAQYGLTRVFRQTFIGGVYELVSSDSFNPNPDFYLSWVFKKLVQGPVLQVKVAPPNSQLRVYANCARRDVFIYPSGALVVYFLNLDDEAAVLSFGQFTSLRLDLFLLTPGTEEGLTSRQVKLNGQLLALTNDQMPALSPNHGLGDITVAAHSFGFIVIPQANNTACLKFNASQPK